MVSLERISSAKSSAVGLAAALLVACLVTMADEGTAAARPFAKDGVVFACVKAGGKEKGTLRIVHHPRRCKKMRGWRRLSWSVAGSSALVGPAGQASAPGIPGISGAPGEAGPQGEPGQIDQALLETIQSQSDQIEALTEQLSSLQGEVADLGETVEGACEQVSLLSERTDELIGAVEGISLDTILAVLLEIPPLPETVGEFECT